MSVSELQFSKTFFPIEVKLLGRLIFTRDPQSENAELCKTVTPAGMLMLLSAEHFLNAANPISFTELGSVMLVIKFKPFNAPVPITVSGCPPKLSGIITLLALTLLTLSNVVSDPDIA